MLTYDRVILLNSNGIASLSLDICPRRFPSASPSYLQELERKIWQVKPETGKKEANFPYPFTENLLPRTSSSEVRGAAAVNAPSTDASMKSRSEMAMGSTAEEADDPPSRREINQWGDTICLELLKVSSLLVCKLKRDDLSSEVQVLVKCSPKEDSSHQWHLFILAAPKKLLMLRGEETIGSCKRHGAKLAAASPESSDQVFVITSCLHPSGHIASIFWDSNAQDSWGEVCREAVGAILSSLNLGQWQTDLMKESLDNLKGQFRVVQGQCGFFSRDERPGALGQLTYEQRETYPYEKTKVKKSRRAHRQAQIPDRNREPHVFRVVQDLLRLVHNMLPLDRIGQLEKQRAEHKCWERSQQAARNFAHPDRVLALLRHVDAGWFHPGEEDGGHCKYGLKADHILDAIDALKKWLRPRAGQKQTGDEASEQMSWRTTLSFYDFEMSDTEIDHLSATAIAILHVRWQWISSWLTTEKLKMSSASSAAA